MYVGKGMLSYLLGKSDLRKRFVVAGHWFLSVPVSPLSLALLKGRCAI